MRFLLTAFLVALLAGECGGGGSASDGQRFLRFDNSATCDQAGGLTFQTSNGWAYRPVSLPQPLPERLYFSMRVRSTTRLDGNTINADRRTLVPAGQSC